MKRIAVIGLTLLMCTMLICAQAEITVTQKDMAINRDLDKSVSNILVLMQDGGVTDTMMIASINSRTGRAVMTRMDCEMEIEVTLENGETSLERLGDVYNMGASRCRGMLVAREINELLNLNVTNYIALEMTSLPAIVENIGVLNMQFDEEEAKALGTWVGINELEGDAILDYVRLKLDTDSPARSRGYDALMQLLYQGLHSGNIMELMGMGKSLLDSMDTNLNVMSAVTLVSAVQAGTDRRELLISDKNMESAEQMREAFHQEVYE